MDSQVRPFSLDFARKGRSVTVAVHGEVDGSSSAVLRRLLLDIVEGQGNLSVDLDLSGMTFIDSAGLTMLLDMHRRALKRGGSFVLHNARPSTVKVFEIAGLNRILTIG